MYSLDDLLSFGAYIGVVFTIITGFAAYAHFKDKK